MFKNKLFKSNLSKIILFFIVFIIILYFGGLLFSWGYRFRRRTLFLRISYMTIATIWSVGNIWWICVRFRFGEYWRGLMDDIYSRQEKFRTDLRLQYQDLMNRYPLAVAEYETYCWKQRPRPSATEIMENALKISNLEWLDREKKAKEKIELRKTQRNSHQ